MEGSEVPLERIVRSESSHSDRQIVSVIKTCLAQGSCQQPRGSGMQLLATDVHRSQTADSVAI